MDLFVLDGQLRRTQLFDRYESLIWTERFAAYGDFQLVIHSTLEARNSFSPGTKLAINESTRVMQVETVEDSKDAEGRTILTIKGPSLEDLLSDRVARDVSVVPYPEDSKWYLTGLPADIIRTIFQKICVDGTIDPGDIIPFYTVGNIYPTDTIPEPIGTTSLSVDVGTVYDTIKQLCEVYDLGFRLVRNGDNSQLMFNIYSGNDRTTLQTALPAVIFSPELDNLQDVSYLTSVSNYKNVAYVVSPKMTLFVYADNIDPAIAGFERRVLYVDASSETYPERPYTVTTAQQASIKAGQALVTSLTAEDDALDKLLKKIRLTATDVIVITSVIGSSTLTAPQKADITAARDTSTAYNPTEDALLTAVLTQKGKEALATQTTLSAFDGEIPPNSQYIYHRDYELGDLVEMRNSDKVTNNMRVTEQIFVSDAQGVRSYPTLAVKLLITAGSWYAWPAGGVWDDITDPAVVWDTV